MELQSCLKGKSQIVIHNGHPSFNGLNRSPRQLFFLEDRYHAGNKDYKKSQLTSTKIQTLTKPKQLGKIQLALKIRSYQVLKAQTKR